MILLTLMFIPFLVGAVAHFTQGTITKKEFALMLAISSLVTWGGYELAKLSAMMDTEHWSGRITAKRHGSVSCCHCHQECDTCYSTDANGNSTSYDCNCHTVCSHSIDWYWLLDVSTGDTLGHSCVHQDDAPGWYQKAYKGEPATVARTYTNYLKADPDNLMTPQAEKYVDQVPEFPQLHGASAAPYHVKRVLSTGGVKVPKGWQKQLDEMNADLGHKYQIDLLFMVTKIKDPDFAKAVEAKWLYGPKNAVTIILGVPDGETIEWARVVTLSEVNVFKIEMRDELPGKKLSDPSILPFVEQEVKEQYTRTPMAEYEYLASDVQPETWMLVLLHILNLLIMGGLIAWMHKEDVFGSDRLGRFGQVWPFKR